MSDWEEFCDANGWNAGSEDDYDEFLDSLEDRPRKFTYSKIQPRRGGTDYFSTFEQASQWSKPTEEKPSRAAVMDLGSCQSQKTNLDKSCENTISTSKNLTKRTLMRLSTI